MKQSVAQQGIRSAVGLAFMVAVSACSGPVINEAYMAKDSAGEEKTDTFYEIGDQIHAIVFANGGHPDTTMTFRLEGPMASDFELYPWPNRESLGKKIVDTQLYRRDPTSGDRLEDGPWPLGKYRMHVDLTDEEFADLDFEVVPIDNP